MAMASQTMASPKMHGMMYTVGCAPTYSMSVPAGIVLAKQENTLGRKCAPVCQAGTMKQPSEQQTVAPVVGRRTFIALCGATAKAKVKGDKPTQGRLSYERPTTVHRLGDVPCFCFFVVFGRSLGAP